DRVVHLVLAHERLELLGAVVDRDADDDEALVLVVRVELHEVGDLRLARAAPRRPEIDDHDLALVLGELDRLVELVLEYEVERALAGLIAGAALRGSGRPAVGGPDRFAAAAVPPQHR